MATRTAPAAATPIGRIRPPRLELDATAPLRLDTGIGGGWLIEQGTVDLFAVGLADGRPRGARLPLCSFAAGELLLALPPVDAHAVIAVGRLGTAVSPLRSEDLAAWPPGAFERL